MPMMPYVSPEQAMKDKADFARKGISRGRSVVALTTDDGMLFVAENPSVTLHKVSEIYDRIAFAAAGKYNEFEQLRVAGIRLADVKGYQYSRDDVTGRGLANAYANSVGAYFTESPKPLEVELLVAEVFPDTVEIYHILYDGSISDEDGFVAIGGNADAINEALDASYEAGMSRGIAVRTAVQALQQVEDREMDPGRMEVAGLDRNLARRKFFRLTDSEVAQFMSGE
ncbi:MAG: proteasome subunit alpha [Euzebya sp.]